MTKPKPPELHKKSGPPKRERRTIHMRPERAVVERFEALKKELRLSATKTFEVVLDGYLDHEKN